MAIATATITTETADLPDGFASFEGYVFSLDHAAGTGHIESQSVTTDTCTFATALNPGDYTVTVQANGLMTVNGVAPLGNPVTTAFTVPAVVVPPATYQSPTGVTVTLS